MRTNFNNNLETLCSEFDIPYEQIQDLPDARFIWSRAQTNALNI